MIKYIEYSPSKLPLLHLQAEGICLPFQTFCQEKTRCRHFFDRVPQKCGDSWQHLFDFFEALRATILFPKTYLDSRKFLFFKGDSLVASHLHIYKNWILTLKTFF